MSKRLLPAAVILGWLTASALPVFALNLFAQLFPLTGEIQLRNKSAAPVPFVFYSIKSPGGKLISGSSVWRSITDNYDDPDPMSSTPGNGVIDPNGEWVEIASLSTELAEGALDDDGGSLAAMRAISLGNIWIASPIPDLVFDIRESNSTPISVTVEFALAGDYLPDGTVNQTDYNLWRQYFGSNSILLADGNLDGIVNAADYVVWRNNLDLSIGLSSSLPANGSALPGLAAGAAAVPEPATAALVLMLLFFLLALAATKRTCRRAAVRYCHCTRSSTAR